MSRLSKRKDLPRSIPPAIGTRTVRYAACGLILGASLTVGGYLIDYHDLYGRLPSSLSIGVLWGLHDVSPVHYFADLFALILAVAGGLAGWFQDRVIFYSNRLEELVEIRTQDLARSQERYALAVDGSNDGIWDWDLVTDQVYYAPRWKKMIGCTDAEVGDRPETWLDRVHPEDIGRVRDRIESHLRRASSHLQVDYRMRYGDGSYRWMLARGVTVRDPSGNPTRMAGSQTDIHERRQAEDQLRRLVLYDQLTGLPNRTLLLDLLERILLRGRRGNMRVAILHIGVDRFKKVNESLGQLAGDQVLVEVGARLSAVVSDFESRFASVTQDREPTGSVFRFEGDEFVVVLEEVRTLRDATRLSEQILKVHEGPLNINDRELLLSLSIGITLGPQQYRAAAEVLRDAQTAMHRAKVQGRARFEVFDREMLETVQESLHLETELFQALEADHLRLWYQPVIDLESRQIVGFEALARWEHPEKGIISPGLFIPIAEETGLIVRLSQRMFEGAFRRLRQWQEQLGKRRALSINMNLSPKWLFHPDLENHLGTLLRKTGADPSRIHLEITETSFIDRPQAVAEVLERLKIWGFRIVLDDFGTGFSSLSMLHEFPFDILKIDQRFVSQLTSEPDVRKIVGTIVDLARNLDLDVIAEGIETEEQLRALCSMHCQYGQGFLLGRPMNVEATEELVLTGVKKSRSTNATAA